VNGGSTVAKYGKSQIVFSQGDLADSVFYIKDGKIKVTVLSHQGKGLARQRAINTVPEGLFSPPEIVDNGICQT
jgi:hypothetical protein